MIYFAFPSLFPPLLYRSFVRSFVRLFVRALARRGSRGGRERERERERKKNSNYVYIVCIYARGDVFVTSITYLGGSWYHYIYIYSTSPTLFSIIPIDRNPLLYYVVIVIATSEPFVMVAVDEHARHIRRPRSYQRSFSACSPFHRRRTFHFQLFLIPRAAEKDWE